MLEAPSKRAERRTLRALVSSTLASRHETWSAAAPPGRTCCLLLSSLRLSALPVRTCCLLLAEEVQHRAQSGTEGRMINKLVKASAGFVSAAKATSQLVGNTAIEEESTALKYFQHLNLMDRSTTGGQQ